MHFYNILTVGQFSRKLSPWICCDVTAAGSDRRLMNRPSSHDAQYLFNNKAQIALKWEKSHSEGMG